MRDLLEERRFLLDSLADLEAERAAGDIDERDYQALKDDYTARAAAVLRALQAEDVPDATPPAARPLGGRLRLVAGAAVVVVVAGLAGLALANAAGERLPGDEATGSIELGTGDRIRRAQALVSEGKVVEALKVYDEILAEDPEHVVALTQRGWLLTRAGLVDQGLEYIDRAVAADPTYPDARFFKAMVLLRDKDQPALAAAEFRAFLALNPPPELVALVEEELRRALELAEARGEAVPPAPSEPAARGPQPAP